MKNILVVYGAKSYPLRATTQDHLYSFRRYSEQRCYYFNMLRRGKPWYRKLPRFLQHIKFDLVIFCLDLLNIQWPPYSLDSFRKQAVFFQEIDAIKVALAQDEFYNTEALDRFVGEYKIDHVYSLAAPPEWKKIYPTVNFEKVKFHRALPGYLDDSRIELIDQIAQRETDRPIDIGYRVIRQQNQHWLGQHGFKKIEIADLFEAKSKNYKLSTDISTRAEDVFLGNDWLKFLLRCKYTIAIEGGASILDKDGSLREKTEAYLVQNPQADFAEVEKACFPGRDGELVYKAISPKHLESCATRTCQILVEGDYNGILIPGTHYIELKQDFSNINQVLRTAQEDQIRAKITQRAYNDIIASGQYTYRYFVASVLRDTLGFQIELSASQRSNQSSGWQFDQIRARFSYGLSRILEVLQWIEVAILSRAVQVIRRRLPKNVENALRKWMS